MVASASSMMGQAMDDPLWCCHLTVLCNNGDVHEHYGYGELPSNARESALNEAAEFAAEREYSFTILGERYA